MQNQSSNTNKSQNKQKGQQTVPKVSSLQQKQQPQFGVNKNQKKPSIVVNKVENQVQSNKNLHNIGKVENKTLNQSSLSQELPLSKSLVINGLNIVQKPTNIITDQEILAKSPKIKQQSQQFFNNPQKIVIGTRFQAHQDNLIQLINSTQAEYNQVAGLASSSNLPLQKSTSMNAPSLTKVNQKQLQIPVDQVKIQTQVQDIMHQYENVQMINSNDMDEEERNFLDYISNLESIRSRAIVQNKNDSSNQVPVNRSSQKSRYQSSSSLSKNKQNQFNGSLVFRIDYFNKMNTSFQQIQIFYSLLRKNEKPNIEFKSQFYNIENQQPKIYIKHIFNKVQPNKDLYLYIEMHGFTKTQADIAKHWTILPLFNENLVLNTGAYKLNFYDIVYSTQLLFQKSLPFVSQTQMCVKICQNKDKDYDKEEIMGINEYQIPDIHSHEKRARTEELFKEQKAKQQQIEQFWKEKDQLIKNNILQQKRYHYEEQLVSDLENEMTNMQNSGNPYIKNKLYRDRDQNEKTDLIDEGFQQDSSQVQFQSRLRPRNYPPKVTHEELEEYKKQRYMTFQCPAYLYMQSSLAYDLTKLHNMEKERLDHYKSQQSKLNKSQEDSRQYSSKPTNKNLNLKNMKKSPHSQFQNMNTLDSENLYSLRNNKKNNNNTESRSPNNSNFRSLNSNDSLTSSQGAQTKSKYKLMLDLQDSQKTDNLIQPYPKANSEQLATQSNQQEKLEKKEILTENLLTQGDTQKSLEIDEGIELKIKGLKKYAGNSRLSIQYMIVNDKGVVVDDQSISIAYTGNQLGESEQNQVNFFIKKKIRWNYKKTFTSDTNCYNKYSLLFTLFEQQQSQDGYNEEISLGWLCYSLFNSEGKLRVGQANEKIYDNPIQTKSPFDLTSVKPKDEVLEFEINPFYMLSD